MEPPCLSRLITDVRQVQITYLGQCAERTIFDLNIANLNHRWVGVTVPSSGSVEIYDGFGNVLFRVKGVLNPHGDMTAQLHNNNPIGSIKRSYIYNAESAEVGELAVPRSLIDSHKLPKKREIYNHSLDQVDGVITPTKEAIRVDMHPYMDITNKVLAISFSIWMILNETNWTIRNVRTLALEAVFKSRAAIEKMLAGTPLQTQNTLANSDQGANRMSVGQKNISENSLQQLMGISGVKVFPFAQNKS